jgi:lysophospholipase L1-like esterase
MQTITRTMKLAQGHVEDVQRKPLWKSAGEAVVCLIVAVVLLEAFFSIAGVGGQEFLTPNRVLGTTHLPRKHVIWRMEGFSADSLNSRGYRDVEHRISKPKGIKRIAVLGDSHSEGLQVPLNDTYARRLESSLNGLDPEKYEVLNFACSGYSTAQEYVQFSYEVEPFKPDITVVLMHWGNTAANIVDPKKRRVAQPRPYFYLDAKGNLKQDNSVSECYLPAGAEDSPWAKTISFLQRNSRIYGVLCQTDMALNNNEKLYFKWRGRFQNMLSYLKGKNLNAEPPGPVYAEQDPIKVTDALVVALADKCTKSGSKLIIMLLPDPSGTAAGRQLSAELTKLGAEHGFGLLDLTTAFKQHPQSKDLFLRVHLSSLGHKFVADTLKDYLEQQNVFCAKPSGSVN